MTPPAHRVYITRGDHVDVVDTNDGKLIGTIGGLHGTHGVALDPDGKVGYISDGGGNAVVVFDRSSLSTVATIPAGTNPDAIIFEPTTKSVWAFNGRSKDITVIDAASRKSSPPSPSPASPSSPQPTARETSTTTLKTRASSSRSTRAPTRSPRPGPPAANRPPASPWTSPAIASSPSATATR